MEFVGRKTSPALGEKSCGRLTKRPGLHRSKGPRARHPDWPSRQQSAQGAPDVRRSI